MKHALAVLAAAVLIAAVVVAPAAAFTDVAATQEGRAVAKKDCGRSIFWFCGKFPSRPIVTLLCTEPKNRPNITIGWCVTVYYKEISFLGKVRTCKTVTKWHLRTGQRLLHIKTCAFLS